MTTSQASTRGKKKARSNYTDLDVPPMRGLPLMLGRVWLWAYSKLFSKKMRLWVLNSIYRDTHPNIHALEWILRRWNRRHSSWPAAGTGSLTRPQHFEDLLPWLFHIGTSNRNLCQLDLDEALALWRLCRDHRPRVIVEIGRFKGGSTFLLACAMEEGARLISFDINKQYDAAFSAVLQETGLAGRVELVVGDSRAAAPTTPAPDLVFVDGGHFLKDVRADIKAWYPRLNPKGMMCFHDAARTRPNATLLRPVAKAVRELRASEDRCRVILEVGSLLVVKKLGANA